VEVGSIVKGSYGSATTKDKAYEQTNLQGSKSAYGSGSVYGSGSGFTGGAGSGLVTREVKY